MSRYYGPGLLVLADGRVFRGQSFGAKGTVVAELVFNTALYGYQEIVSDPSYAEQIVCLTAVEIGNVGTNPDDDESEQPAARGLVIRSLSPVVSNYRATTSLHDWLVGRGVIGLAEVDTRALTRHLRDHGSVMAALTTDPAHVTDASPSSIASLRELAAGAPPMQGRNLVDAVTTDQPYTWTTPSWGKQAPAPIDARVVAYDFGIKRNILRKLRDRGIETTVVPASTPIAEVLGREPDGVFLSNGPGDPAAVEHVIAQLRELVGGADARRRQLPIFGICLGHQLLCLALGGRTYKLEFGHHGGNHPVRDERDKSIAITSQNHGFAVDVDSLGDGVKLTHINLFDRTVAGVELEGRPVFGVQYHPEACPGPQDSDALFQRFVDAVREHRQASSAGA
ncbi:glutamine-hydrolyzing carbamoyl-phosphate synthase small subunit [Enhygromyxa salina]|uniref:glutamine-hydrolyzing carbamoyl-phosphate synthase small subunit n=1 Tax=Enhygromyxa salina TaxID=215803 RepID=UPI001FD32D70|nr:glutamine-hydrolyzing carbamoyl-phosphate synthase small subunit [Enhygromyxa salina]